MNKIAILYFELACGKIIITVQTNSWRQVIAQIRNQTHHPACSPNQPDPFLEGDSGWGLAGHFLIFRHEFAQRKVGPWPTQPIQQLQQEAIPKQKPGTIAAYRDAISPRLLGVLLTTGLELKIGSTTQALIIACSINTPLPISKTTSHNEKP